MNAQDIYFMVKSGIGATHCVPEIEKAMLDAYRAGLSKAAEIAEAQGCRSIRISAKGYAQLIRAFRDDLTKLQ